MQDVVEKDIPALPANFKKSIQRAIQQRLTVNPLAVGKPLKGNLKNQLRLRVGSYRIIYEVDNEKARVTINAIDHRKDVYN